MANLGKWSGGVDADLDPGTSWAEATTLFPTEDRNDGSVYGKSNATITLPSSGLADGYLFIGAFEFEDTSNGRCNPQGRFIQASGTGTFVGGPTGGYNRDTSEDRSYVRCWAFVDNPSASSTYTFQWKRDVDAPSTGDGSVRSELQVIPFYYSNHGLYSSTSASLYGGTTPNQVTGWTADDESDTAAIELVSNVVTVKTDNKRYLVLGSQFFEGRGGRTQRWHGLDIDGSLENAAKSYSYYRDTSNDESGDMFTWLIDRVTTDITIEQSCYRGDGVSNGQGGADVDGSTPSVGDHALVVLELNDDAEVFRSQSSTNSSNLAASPTDLNCNETTDFNDSASFTDPGNTAINCVQTADYLFGANVSVAANNVADTTRWTAYSEFHINGTEDADSVAGDYLRNNQGTQDTFGWSANLLGFQALAAGDDVGVSVTELSGSEGGGAPISPAGWTGFWGLNLDTLETASDTNVNANVDALTLTSYAACAGYPNTFIVLGTTVNDINLISTNVIDTCPDEAGGDTEVTTNVDALTLTENQATISLDIDISAGTDSLTLTENQATVSLGIDIQAGTDSLTLTENQATITLDVDVQAGTDSLTLTENQASIALDIDIQAGTDSLTLTENQADVGLDIDISASTDTLTLTENASTVTLDVDVPAGVDNLTLTEQSATITYDVNVQTSTDALVLTTFNASVGGDILVNASTDALTLTENQAEISLDIEIQAGVDALVLTEYAATVVANVDVNVSASTDSLTLTEFPATIEYGEVSSGGGSTKSAKEEQRKQREYNRKLKAQQQVQEKPVKKRKAKKPKKVIKVDLKKQLKVAKKDEEWVRKNIDEPLEKYNNTIDYELRLRDQTARAEANRQMEEAIAEHERFIRDEEEAIAQILISMFYI